MDLFIMMVAINAPNDLEEKSESENISGISGISEYLTIHLFMMKQRQEKVSRFNDPERHSSTASQNFGWNAARRFQSLNKDQ